jgi:hypothetical protein
MNTNYKYPNLVTKFLALPIRRAKLVTIYALQREENFIMESRDAEQIATWYNTLEKIVYNVASDDNPSTNLELLQTISEYEDDPSIALKHIGFDEKESQ